MPYIAHMLLNHFSREAYPNTHEWKSNRETHQHFSISLYSSRYLEVQQQKAQFVDRHASSFWLLLVLVVPTPLLILHQFPKSHNFRFRYSNTSHCVDREIHFEFSILHIVLRDPNYNTQPNHSFLLLYRFLHLYKYKVHTLSFDTTL